MVPSLTGMSPERDASEGSCQEGHRLAVHQSTVVLMASSRDFLHLRSNEAPYRVSHHGGSLGPSWYPYLLGIFILQTRKRGCAEKDLTGHDSCL
jgi:hypothetical protein